MLSLVVRAALYWARYLKEHGVARAFGYPGTESIELLEAAREAGLEFVLTQHEATAAFAASMTGRLTGIPGVCVTTAGPGATNAASGIAQAHLDRMPLLVFTGDHVLAPGQPTHQRLSPELFAAVTRATVRLSAANLAVELPRAFRLATTPPHGPVHLTFPSGEMETDVGEPPTGRAADPLEGAPALPDLSAVRAMIAAAKRPMIIAGLGVPNARAEGPLLRFATSLGAPVADTQQSRGSLPTDHPLYLGTFATHRDAAVTDCANASDLVVAVGLDSVEFLKKWRLSPPVLVLTDVGAGNDPAIPAALAVEGALAALLEALVGVRAAGRWPAEEIAGFRQRSTGSLMPPESDAGRALLWPQTVVRELQKALPDDGIVTVDVGSHKHLMVLQWVVRHPDSFLDSSGLSSMGTGIPFALAAKLVHPARPVVAVVGDGGFLMYAGELASLGRIGAPLVIVVMADGTLNSIKIKQVRRSYAPTGTELGAGYSIAGVARAFGLNGERVSSAAECAAALRRGLTADRPTVIEAAIDPAGYEYSQ